MISFEVPGPVPSKSNYRYSNTPKARQRWARIKQYEQDVALSAMAAGAKKHSGKCRVKVLLVNQKVDLDGALKAPLDGLRGVCYPDDSPKHLEAIQVCFSEDDGPVRAEYRVEWE